MNPEKNNSAKYAIITITAIILLGLIVWVVYAVKNGGSPVSFNDVNPSTTVPTSHAAEQTVNVKHQYKNGIHTYVGQIDVDSPCDKLSYKVINDSSVTASTTIAFSTAASEMTSGGVCYQVITAQLFKVSFAGPQNEVVKATLDGVPVVFNIFEVPANQDLDTFQIQVKG
jgi:hypothetical protein